VRYPDEGFAGTINIANAIWVDRTVKVLKPFEALIDGHYDAGVYRLDLVIQPQRASKIINQWANKNTLGDLDDVMHYDCFTTQRHTITLTSCASFEDQLLLHFKRENTNTEKFLLWADEYADVPMMHGEGTCGYAKVDNLDILDVEYAGRQHSLMIVLPPAGNPLFNEDYRLIHWKEWRKKCTQQRVKLAMPRITPQTHYGLRGALEGMGVQEFDLSRIGDVGKIVGIFHKAKLRIDEAGSKTVVGKHAREVSGGGEAVTIRLDRPYWLLLLERKTGLILMMGHIGNPAKVQ
jgi:serine protease inhibitor